jgi:hypothetical protein
MAKTPKKPKPEEVETVPDGWDRFQKTMDKIVPPKRRPRDGDEPARDGGDAG